MISKNIEIKAAYKNIRCDEMITFLDLETTKCDNIIGWHIIAIANKILPYLEGKDFYIEFFSHITRETYNFILNEGKLQLISEHEINNNKIYTIPGIKFDKNSEMELPTLACMEMPKYEKIEMSLDYRKIIIRKELEVKDDTTTE